MAELEDSDRTEHQLKQQEYYDNRVAFFDSWVKAWIEYRMELDKQLLTLSALAIGLLIGVFGHPETVTQFCLWLSAGMAFLVCGALILILFHLNTTYIEVHLEEHQTPEDADEKVILGQKEEQKTKQLNRLTKIAFLLFLSGTTLTLFLAISQSGFTIMKGI